MNTIVLFKTHKENSHNFIQIPGKHYIHQRCANITYKNKKKLNLKLWSCDDCSSLSFKEITNDELTNFTYNSLLNCRCQSKLNIYHTNQFDNLLNLPVLTIDNPISGNSSVPFVHNFKYYTTHEFHKPSMKANMNSNNLSILHTNIRSFAKNINNLCNLVDLLDHKFDIIGLSEIWQQNGSTIQPESLPGYHVYEHCCGTTRNSGCGLYIKENLNYKVRQDLSTSFCTENEEFQILFIEILNVHNENILVGITYRHPTGKFIDKFKNNLEEIFEKTKKENKKQIIMGDFNINLLDYNNHSETNTFLDFMLNFSFLPHITQPTRLSEKGKYTLIDNIFYNDITDICTSGNILNSVTDHLPNFIIIYLKSLDRNNLKMVKRDFSKFNLDLFKDDLRTENINKKLNNFDNVNDLKTKKKDHKQLRKPWKKTSAHPTTIIQNGKTLTKPCDIASAVNQYYVNVAPNLVKKLPKSKEHFTHFLTNPVSDSFFCNAVTHEEMTSTIMSLDDKKAIDIYHFPIKIWKDVDEIIANPLCKIVNESFSSGIFPDKLKLAKVLPLFKSGDRYEAKNYRPISILPIFDKIIERLMHTRLVSFLDCFNIINTAQYGFQKHKSTNHAIFEVINKVSQALKNKTPSSCVFLDLAKAFDTVDHTILLRKLHHYGIRGIQNKWFASYLTDRKQSVSILNSLSPPLSIQCGVPQGSILGPLLFVLYINDISNASKVLEVTQFADDTCLFLKRKNKYLLVKDINHELNNISEWLISNALSLNVKKSNFLYFRNKQDEESPLIKIMGSKIEQKQVVKYLGIHIDDKLNWEEQETQVKIKTSQGIGILHKVKHLIPASLMYMPASCNLIYYTVTLPGDLHIPNLTNLTSKSLRFIKSLIKL
ncbi:uncharacterized protein LOC130629748 [Hydractinia symbiolongicarpus]|uniref:uncharacterized protein LOC130629748 n=1 Tax=Hydractinia symbiolongicarpus TaxID=13093 RepID=UPI002550A9D7|nr:uncharacterized protein LOC130629748 [Hydractinia symbiolongicarpus]